MDRSALYRRALGLAQPTLVSGGTWIYLDGGVLDLGLVRDSQLNSGNDFQIFGETFGGKTIFDGGYTTSEANA